MGGFTATRLLDGAPRTWFAHIHTQVEYLFCEPSRGMFREKDRASAPHDALSSSPSTRWQTLNKHKRTLEGTKKTVKGGHVRVGVKE